MSPDIKPRSKCCDTRYCDTCPCRCGIKCGQ